jgi:hypothetical protein
MSLVWRCSTTCFESAVRLAGALRGPNAAADEKHRASDTRVNTHTTDTHFILADAVF